MTNAAGVPDAVSPRRASHGPAIQPKGALVLYLVARVFMMLAQPWASEDAYITFRYAENLAQGHGLVYNRGEWVMGFTSPVWTLWCALGALVHAPLVVWAQGTSLVVGLLALKRAMDLLTHEASATSALVFGIAYALWPFFGAITVSGLEAELLFALIVLASLAVHARERSAGPLLGLLALTRPEGTVAAVVIACFANPRARLVGGAFLAVGAGALAWAYGSPVPSSLLAKQAVYGTPGPWLGRYWWDWLLPLPAVTHTSSSDGALLARLGWFWLPAAALGVREAFRSRGRATATVAAAGLGVWSGYAVLGVTYFWWYAFLPVATLAWLAALGVPRLPSALSGRVGLGVALFIMALSWMDVFPVYLGRAQNEFRTFHPVAAYLEQVASPNDVVFSEPIGMIGYFTHLRMIDEPGLVSPIVTRLRLHGDGWYTEVIRARHPRWLVVRPATLRTGEAFAGRARPFRDDAERLELLNTYHRVWPERISPGDALWLFEARESH